MSIKNKGRPTKFRPDSMQVEIMCNLYREFLFTDRQVADAIGISERALNYWKKQNPSFLQSIKSAKAVANSKAKQALYLRAIGYSHPEEKVFCQDGVITTYQTTKHYPPDTGALVYFTKNRMPEEFRDKHDVTVNNELADEIKKGLDEAGGIAGLFEKLDKVKTE